MCVERVGEAPRGTGYQYTVTVLADPPPCYTACFPSPFPLPLYLCLSLITFGFPHPPGWSHLTSFSCVVCLCLVSCVSRHLVSCAAFFWFRLSFPPPPTQNPFTRHPPIISHFLQRVLLAYRKLGSLRLIPPPPLPFVPPPPLYLHCRCVSCCVLELLFLVLLRYPPSPSPRHGAEEAAYPPKFPQTPPLRVSLVP